MQVYGPVVLSSFRQIPIQIIGRRTKHTLVIDVRIIQTETFATVTARLLSTVIPRLTSDPANEFFG